MRVQGAPVCRRDHYAGGGGSGDGGGGGGDGDDGDGDDDDGGNDDGMVARPAPEPLACANPIDWEDE